LKDSVIEYDALVSKCLEKVKHNSNYDLISCSKQTIEFSLIWYERRIDIISEKFKTNIHTGSSSGTKSKSLKKKK